MCEKKENRVSLPSYAWSPWKEGRSKEEQRELQEIQDQFIDELSGFLSEHLESVSES